MTAPKIATARVLSLAGDLAGGYCARLSPIAAPRPGAWRIRLEIPFARGRIRARRPGMGRCSSSWLQEPHQLWSRMPPR